MKKQLIVLSAAAMVAAAAVPALAFENEFHGMYRLRGSMTNFQAAGLAGVEGATKSVGPPVVKYNGDEALLSSRSRSYTLFEQRARLLYIAKANDDLKLVTHFEIDSTWGDAAYQTGRGMGGGIAADTVNLETKNVYLDFNLPSTPVNVKLGIQGFYDDGYKGIFLFDDVGGALATGKFGAVTTRAAFLRTYDQGGTTALGKKNVDVYLLDGKFALSKAVTLGASYILANNDVNYSGQQTHTVGVNAAAKLGIVDLDAFLLYQGGDELYATSGKDLSAFAGQIAAKANLGVVTVRAAGLYASGDDGADANKSNAYQNIFASGAPGATAGGSTSSGSYYSANMLLLMRSILAMDSDNALVSSINNGGRGLVAAFIGADTKINDKLSASVNIGHAMVEKKLATSANTNENIGTEANVSVNYALYPNLTATLQGAYVLLGGYTTGGKVKDLKDPYLTGLMMNYTF